MLNAIFSTSLIPPLEIAKWVFVVLFVASTIGVIVGVYWEGEKFDKNKQHRGWLLLIRSLATETMFGVMIFLADGWISEIQRHEIIALETRIAPRVLEDNDFAAIKRAVDGKVKAVSVLASIDTEPAMFSAQLQAALDDAGVAVTPVPSRPENRFVGIQLCLPDQKDPKGTPLWEALSAIGENPGGCSVKDRIITPLIIVGERPPFFPNGAPKSFKMRSYPGFQGPVLP